MFEIMTEGIDKRSDRHKHRADGYPSSLAKIMLRKYPSDLVQDLARLTA
jgi:hypothetical protein